MSLDWTKDGRAIGSAGSTAEGQRCQRRKADLGSRVVGVGLALAVAVVLVKPFDALAVGAGCLVADIVGHVVVRLAVRVKGKVIEVSRDAIVVVVVVVRLHAKRSATLHRWWARGSRANGSLMRGQVGQRSHVDVVFEVRVRGGDGDDGGGGGRRRCARGGLAWCGAVGTRAG